MKGAKIQFEMNIGTKLLMMGLGSVLLTTILMIGIAFWQSQIFSEKAQEEAQKLIDADLDHITEGVYNLIHTQDRSIQQKVDAGLNVARYLLHEAGGARLGEEQVAWQAINQFTKEPTEVRLSTFMVGDQWLGQTYDPAVKVPVVDQITEMIGSTATIFQRMNQQGDMLWVATSVQTEDGRRAIGTYIPAMNADGTPNPVVAALLKGQTYHGMAYVVDAWYVTAYEPLFDDHDEVIGAIYVGVRQENIPELREAILQTKVGKTGYVFILGGKGQTRGHYIISKGGERDGENIWEAKDSEGRYFIQSMIEKAIALKPGEFATERYPWQNPGDPEPRWKVARLAYYEPWDWVIGAGAYEDDFRDLWLRLAEGRRQMVQQLALFGAILATIGSLLIWRFSRSISQPLQRMAHAAQGLAQGDVEQMIQEKSQDEIGLLAQAFRQMIAYIQEVAGAAQRLAQGDLTISVNPRSERDVLGQSFSEMISHLRSLVAQIQESAQRVAEASQEITAATRQSAQATAQAAVTIQQVAQGASEQAESVSQVTSQIDQMAQAIDGIARGAQEQAMAISQVSGLISQLSQAIEQVAALAQAQADDARHATEVASTSSAKMNQMIHGMAIIKEKVALSAQKVQEMGNRSDQIGAIVQTIEDIAEQTNLLALNAAIEAARAGEQGRGFAVVADEVRKLAERSAKATKEIAELVVSIQRTVSEAVTAMDEGAQEVKAGVQRAHEAGEALNQLLQAAEAGNRYGQQTREAAQKMSILSSGVLTAIENVSAIVEENTASTEQLAASSGGINEAMESVASISGQNSAAAEEVSSATEEISAQAQELSASAQMLAQIAQELQETIARFRLGENSIDREPEDMLKALRPVKANDTPPKMPYPSRLAPMREVAFAPISGNGKPQR
jgi:methyl-accepting chemotaxis protein